MTKTPVVMISFNRPDLVRLTMRNVSLAEGANDREITMFIDGPRNDSDKAKQNEIFDIVESYQDILPRLKIVRRDRNLGCRGNIVDAITTELNRSGRAIVIEDDILVSRTFLRYMDEALEFYENDKRIWCINAYQNPYFKVPKGYRFDLYLNPVNMCWGWGTWKDRWQGVDFDLKTWEVDKQDAALIARLNKAGRQIIPMIDAQYAGRLKTWDVQCTYHVVKNGLRCVEPIHQLSKNVGFGFGGEHFSGDLPFLSRQKYFNFMPRMVKTIPEVEEISRQWEYTLCHRNLFERIKRKFIRGCAWLRRANNEPLDVE